jgi:hypothetical protein
LWDYTLRKQKFCLKDPRFKAIKSLIDSKGISSLKDIFTIIPLTVVKDAMKANYNTLRSKVNKGETLTMKDIITMASLFEVEAVEVFRLAINDINDKNKVKRK